MEKKLIEEKIKLAESSISVIENENLKEKAFEVVLTLLLQQSGRTAGTISAEKTFKQKQTKTKRVSNSKNSVKAASQLKFSAEQLEELKLFYDKFKPAGSELNIFVLASFLQNNLNVEHFHENDIKYTYDQLLAVRTITRPPALNLDQIKRALSWLISPTRKKMWLESDGNGMYTISSNGVLKLRDMESEQNAQINQK